MPLSSHAQETVDREIDERWRAYRKGAIDFGTSLTLPSIRHNFCIWMRDQNPMLAIYIEQEKLT